MTGVYMWITRDILAIATPNAIKVNDDTEILLKAQNDGEWFQLQMPLRMQYGLAPI